MVYSRTSIHSLDYSTFVPLLSSAISTEKKEVKRSLNSLRPAEAFLDILPAPHLSSDFCFTPTSSERLNALLKSPASYTAADKSCTLFFSIDSLLKSFKEKLIKANIFHIECKLVGGAVLEVLPEDYFINQVKKVVPKIEFDDLPCSDFQKKLNDLDIRIYLPPNTNLNTVLEIYLNCLFEAIIDLNPPKREMLRSILFKKLHLSYNPSTGQCLSITSLKGVSSVDLELIFIVENNSETKFRFLKESLYIPINEVVFSDSDIICPASFHSDPYAVCYHILTQSLSLPKGFVLPVNDSFIYFSRMARYGEWALNSHEEKNIQNTLNLFLKQPNQDLIKVFELIDKLFVNHHSHALSSFACLFNLSLFLQDLISPQSLKILWKRNTVHLSALQDLPKLYVQKITQNQLPFKTIVEDLSLLAFFFYILKRIGALKNLE